MIPENLERQIEQELLTIFNTDVEVKNASGIGGGCIHHATRIETTKGDFFLKYNEPSMGDNFSCEARGLQRLAAPGIVRVPEVLSAGDNGKYSWILLEFIRQGPKTDEFWIKLGSAVGELHRIHGGKFGLEEDNYIGSLQQYNREYDSWADFFVEMRLQKQLEISKKHHPLPDELMKSFEKLFSKIKDLMPEMRPCLLHGDLWSGNMLADAEGHPVLIDPAVYYGHPEAEIAFTRLFGGFDPLFYEAYLQHIPLEAGWEARTDLFNLYPLLVHYNMFGRSYLPQIEAAVKKYT